jgi:hypothetical protein
LTGGLGEVTKAELAALRAMVAGFGRYQKRSAGAERDQLLRHRDAIRFSLDHLTRSVKFRGIATATTHAVVARAWYSCDRDLLRHFADVLRTGVAKGENDEPILMLFQYLVSGQTSHRSGAYRNECYGKTERALAAFLKSERLTRLHATPKELFPLPSESGVAA